VQNGHRVAAAGMLLKHSSQLHGKLWRTIRRKHAAAYRPWAILRLWWEARDGTGRVSLGKALAAYALAAALPDTWFSRLVGGLRRRHLEGHRSAYEASTAKSTFAV